MVLVIVVTEILDITVISG